jgi:hypothetical protein
MNSGIDAVVITFLSLALWVPFARADDARPASTRPANTAVVPFPKLENDSYDWYARHDAVLAEKKTADPEVVLIGDSITHFWAGEPAARAFLVLLARGLRGFGRVPATVIDEEPRHGSLSDESA